MKRLLVLLTRFAVCAVFAAAGCTAEHTSINTGKGPGGSGPGEEQIPVYEGEPEYDDGNYGGLLAQVFQSGMVLQQGKPLVLFGNAEPGAVVAVKPSWASEKKIIANESGLWKITFDVPSVQPGDYTGRSLVVTCGKELRALDNLLLGEVWFFSGQSNMAMTMRPDTPWHNGVLNSAAEIAAANFPGIRLYKMPKRSSDTPQNLSDGTWQVCTPQTAAVFSGAAYYFGRKIHLETGYAVGLVLAALGSMGCETFTPAETLKADPELKSMFWDPYASGAELADGKRPSHLYNGMIHPFTGLSIRGFCWYQGENNAGHREVYTRLNAAMIAEWRNRFGQGALPFYYVQMTPYTWGSSDFYVGSYAFFREAQERVMACTVKTDMACTMDSEQIATIHPSDKKLVGERLAALALHHDYGHTGTYKGPVFDRMTVDGGTVIVHYKVGTGGSGLETRDGAAPKHFYLAGSDRKFYLAEAVIRGAAVEVTSSSVPAPVAVRYAFLTFPVTNLQNREGFAAYPFRSDDWTDAKYVTP